MRSAFLSLLIITLSFFNLSSYAVAQYSDASTLFREDARAARLNSLNEQFDISLSDEDRALISLRCTTAQTALTKIRDRAKVVREGRTSTYANVVSGLTILKAIFERDQLDSSMLDLLIVSYQQKTTTFNGELEGFIVALNDAIEINCTQNPNEFMLFLEGTRLQQEEVIQASRAIDVLSATVLPSTFVSLRQRYDAWELQNGR